MLIINFSGMTISAAAAQLAARYWGRIRAGLARVRLLGSGGDCR